MNYSVQYVCMLEECKTRLNYTHVLYIGQLRTHGGVRYVDTN